MKLRASPPSTIKMLKHEKDDEARELQKVKAKKQQRKNLHRAATFLAFNLFA